MDLRGLMLLVLLCGSAGVWAQGTPPPVAPPASVDVESKPLPPVPELLKVVEQHQQRDEALLLQYTYHVHHVMEEFDGDEAVKKTTVTDSESFTVGGVRIQRIVARDGKPLTPEEAKKENKRVDEEIATAQKYKAKRDAKVAEGKNDPVIISASRMLELGTFSNERRVTLNGRPTIVLDYAGNRDVKTKNKAEDMVKNLVGTVWFDEADRVIARTEGRFLGDFKLGLGMILDIHKGLSFTFEQQKINSEAWLPKEFAGQGKASVGVVVFRVHGRTHTEMSDYRKFHTTSTIIGSNGVIGDDGKPLEPVTVPPTEPQTKTPQP
jgi:hypothetical protein